MEMRNCPECGKVFTYIRTNLCSECQKKDEELFRKVRKYIALHPGTDILTVSKETEVAEKKIIRYLREGRIKFGTDQCQILSCEICGSTITNGRLCSKCSERLTAGLKKSIQEENKKALEEIKDQGPRMYTANHWLRRDR